tara:strand:+ start:322 stop:507 length:186 start_codon:yes stop_codon:yes gene_type:complete
MIINNGFISFKNNNLPELSPTIIAIVIITPNKINALLSNLSEKLLFPGIVKLLDIRYDITM